MERAVRTLVAAALALGLCSACNHRTTTVRHTTSETIRTDPRPPEDANLPPPAGVEENTTVIKRSHTRTEEGQ